MLQDGLISRSCPGGRSSRTVGAPRRKGHLQISQTPSPLSWSHVGWIKGVQAVPREAWAAMKQASFEPNTLRPRGTQPCSQGRLAQRSSRSPHCSRGRAASAPLTGRGGGRRALTRRRRRRLLGVGWGRQALEPHLQTRSFPDPGRLDGGPPLGHTPESSEKFSKTRPVSQGDTETDLRPRQTGQTG